jgi:hypothetical protein
MKHLALFLAFFGGIMLLYQVPKLIDHELATDATAPDQIQARLESLENRLDRQPSPVPPHPTRERPTGCAADAEDNK